MNPPMLGKSRKTSGRGRGRSGRSTTRRKLIPLSPMKHRQSGPSHCVSVSTSTKPTKRPTTKDKGKGKVKAENAEATTVSRLRKPKEKMYALPNPRFHHRYRFEGRTERLTVRPSLFESSSLALTSSFTERPIVSERVNKAWGYNVGYGPLWDLAEDRDGIRKLLLWGTTPILRRSVGHGSILIYVFKMAGRSWAWSM